MPTAIITGATKGIGKAIAEKLLYEGFDIAICARNENDLRDIQQQWQEKFPEQNILSFAADVGNEDELNYFAREALGRFPVIDILVNNAGIFLPGNVCDEPEGQMEKVMNTNLMSAYHLSRAIIPSMRSQKRGHIFNICSIAALKAYPGGGSYSISKAAMLSLSENLRYELMQDHIKVTAISPGAVWSHSWSGSGIPEGRMMKAADIADTVWSAYSLSAQATIEHIIMRPQPGDL